jgi:hypothetical protein
MPATRQKRQQAGSHNAARGDAARQPRAAKKRKPAAPATGPPLDGNEYLTLFKQTHAGFPSDMGRLLDPELPGGDDRRQELLALIDGAAALRYSWAVPDARALRIIGSLGPVVEIGCGHGYWARLLRDAGADVIAYDHKLPPKKQRWTDLKKGGPEVLSDHSERALMLCYPDDFEDCGESMAEKCLLRYRGNTIVHIGELLGVTSCLPSPW